MSASTAEVVICGAGIAGIAAAYELAVHRGMKDVVLVEQDAPLSLTSDKSTECYRNWWPGPGDAMVRLMNRSIDRLEWLARETDNRFLLNRRGYLYASARDSAVAEFRRAADEAAGLGAGAVRMHEVSLAHYQPAPAAGFEDQPTGADIIVGAELVASQFPYLARDTVTALHARRCGWLSAQQLGMLLLEAAREHGVRLVRGRMQSVDASGGRIGGIRVDADGGVEIIATPRLVIAAGPHVNAVAALLDIELPIYSERHVKMTFEDARGVVPREAPLFIWVDPVRLPWDEEERGILGADPTTAYLLEEFPGGAHGRPLGEGRSVILYWTYDSEATEVVFPLEWDSHLPEIVLRGMSEMIPALGSYFARLPRAFVDGGYYTKTRENRPLMGPLAVEGAFVHAAFSGFGIMAAMGAAELLADHVTGARLPQHAWAFTLERYDDPQYRQWLESWDESGQL